MTQENETKQEQSISEQAAPAAPEGVRARRAFMLKFLIGGDGDWINKNIVAGGKGTAKIVGRVFGACMGAEKKVNVLPDGSSSESIVLYGQFEYESTVTGEIGQASSVYLPMAYAQQVAAVFASDATVKALEVDVDIGLEATGKTIPYEWLVINHVGGEASLLSKLRNRRRPGQKALPGTSTSAAAQIEQAKPEAATEAAEEPAAAPAKASPAKGSKK